MINVAIFLAAFAASMSLFNFSQITKLTSRLAEASWKIEMHTAGRNTMAEVPEKTPGVP